MIPINQAEFEKLFEAPENKKCFDCMQSNPQWASVNNAIFLCLNCSGIHRGFGVHISFVRSVSMDAWSDKQMKMMQLGGNRRLYEFFEEYHLNSESVQMKYKTVAAEYYREMLKTENMGAPVTKPRPTYEEGRQLDAREAIASAQSSENVASSGMYSQINRNEEQKSSDNSFMGKAASGFMSFWNKASEITNKTSQVVKQKMDEYHVVDKVKATATVVASQGAKLGHAVYEGAKDLGTIAYEKGKEIGETPQVQKLSSDAKDGLNKVSSKIKNMLGVEHQQPQQDPNAHNAMDQPLVENPTFAASAEVNVNAQQNNVQPPPRYPDQI